MSKGNGTARERVRKAKYLKHTQLWVEAENDTKVTHASQERQRQRQRRSGTCEEGLMRVGSRRNRLSKSLCE